MASREWTILYRGRAVRGSLGVLVALAWLPPILLSLRSGALGVASFDEVASLQLALAAVIVPLLCLLGGADAMAGEIEDASIVTVLSAPISRLDCLIGKCVGRAALLTVAFAISFGSAGATMAIVHGASGAFDYSLVVGFALALSLVCGAIGVALGAGGGGRLRAFGGSLLIWVLLVFVVDALLLGAIVATAPAGPREVGIHGHSELGALVEGENGQQSTRSPIGWILILDPVDLYRLSTLSLAPGLRQGLTVAGESSLLSVPALLLGWTAWLTVPLIVAARRFRRAMLF